MIGTYTIVFPTQTKLKIMDFLGWKLDSPLKNGELRNGLKFHGSPFCLKEKFIK